MSSQDAPRPDDRDEPHQGPIEKVEHALRETAAQAEVAAWQTVYEVEDVARDAVEWVAPHENGPAPEAAPPPEHRPPGES
jgi:hypothetical protein